MDIRSGKSTGGFLILASRIQNQVLVPRYYDPEIKPILDRLSQTHDLKTIGELAEAGIIEIRQGKEIGKLEYGTGVIPFIRTSDMANWELKSDPKQGVSEDVYLEIKDTQDVRAEDILYVRDGTYLVGSACILTEADTKIAFQSHISKIRVLKKDQLDPYLLLAILSSPPVLKQVVAKRLTADIIDTLGQRIFEIVLPIPKSDEKRRDIASRMKNIIQKRNEFRRLITELPNEIQGLSKDAPADVVSRVPAYLLSVRKIVNNILVPKYYNPALMKQINSLRDKYDLKSIKELADKEIVSLETGDEIGKMAYGTGDIPFVRTSDIVNWGLKVLPKQGVSEDIYQEWRKKQEVRPNDIFLVRDGTYLVGSNCIITASETKLLFCGGIYRIRVEKPQSLNPFLLLGILNTPIVRRQMRAKQFTRDVIDTLGKRIYEVILPIPKEDSVKKGFSDRIESIITEKYQLLEEQRKISKEVAR